MSKAKYNHDLIHSMDDATLWRLFRNGNTRVFEAIYSRYVNFLANYGRRLCSDDEILKDAIQDLFTDLWRNRNNLGSTDSIQYYLIKAFRRNLIKKLKSARKHLHPNLDFQNFELSPEMAITNAENEQERLDLLKANLESLTVRQKEVIFLRFYCGLDYSGISRVMDINSQSAYNLVHRVLKVLREKMLHNISTVLLILLLI